jgi:hypothetical protein
MANRPLRTSLTFSVFDRLTEIRESQTRQLDTQISDLKNSLAIYSRGSTATAAVEAFTAGFDQLNTATIDPGKQQSIVDYYDNTFAKVEDNQTGDIVDVDDPTWARQQLWRTTGIVTEWHYCRDRQSVSHAIVEHLQRAGTSEPKPCPRQVRPRRYW